MQSIIVKQTQFRFLFALLFLSLLAWNFWTTSRYPSLDDKALMAGSIHLEDPLSFEARWPLQPEFPVWKKIIVTTANWVDTNRKGMTFGLMMGAAMLTLLRYLSRISFRGSFLNSFLGMAMGAPMGVCVNCAAPIAKGMYSGGARAETTLSAMIASPTLNIVVLTMAFSILPFYLAITKVILSLIVILLAVPLICRFILTPNELQIADAERGVCEIPTQIDKAPESLGGAVFGFARDYLVDLWYILRMTVPLMLLAGFLGAIVATLIPIEALSHAQFTLLGLLLIAIVGTFLPVPIAFDVVICGALLAGGLNVGYVMTLLFTLGSISIYSFFIIGQSISLRSAGLLAAIICFLGAAAGLGVYTWHDWQTKRALEILTTASDDTATQGNATLPDAKNDDVAMALDTNATAALGTLEITPLPFKARSPAGDKPFTHSEANTIGIDQPIEFSFKDMWPPFWEGRSISAGDFDRDGDQDIIIASTKVGIYFYLNNGAGNFTRTTMNITGIQDYPIFNAALVDMNNDGWLDIFYASYQKGNYILWNQDGKFSDTRMAQVNNRDDAMLSLSLSFGDINRDGYLDAAIGNWAAGWYRRIPGEESRNRIILNDDGKMTGKSFTELPGMPGETLSILLTDINADGALDLLEGNDFEQPDIYYIGDGKGDFKQIVKQDGVIPLTTNTTMAIKNNDLDNDLVPEIYLAQIAGRASGISDRVKMQPIENYCDNITRKDDREICVKNMQIKTWYKSGNNFDPSYAGKCQQLEGVYQAECKAMLTKDLAIQAEDPSICELISTTQPQAKAYCLIHFRPIYQPTQDEIFSSYPQVMDRNVLLKRQENGTYSDQSKRSGLEVGGWSWDTKIADFDNDEWADVYIVNGTWVPNEFTPSNLFYQNQGDGTFTEASGPYGLEDYLMTAAGLQLDIDSDGDLDLITVPVNGPIQAFINNSQTGNAIGFYLDDAIGNRFGVGAKVVIHYDEKSERHQIREIQSGGGFQSFDTAYAHFGLGKFTHVNSVTIYWPDGTVSEISEPLQAGASYRITRN